MWAGLSCESPAWKSDAAEHLCDIRRGALHHVRDDVAGLVPLRLVADGVEVGELVVVLREPEAVGGGVVVVDVVRRGLRLRLGPELLGDPAVEAVRPGLLDVGLDGVGVGDRLEHLQDVAHRDDCDDVLSGVLR